MIELLPQFLAEMSDLLEQVDSGLLALERDPADRGVLDEVFRAAHTLKGSSGLFDLPQLTRLTHAAEDLLDAVRSGRLELTPALTDDLLAAFDVVRQWHGDLTATGAMPADAAQVGAALATRLRAPLGGDPEVPAQRGSSDGLTDGDPDAAGGAGRLGPAPAWVLDGLGAAEVTRLRDWLLLARTRCRVFRYEPAAQCFVSGDDPMLTVSQVPAVESLAIAPSRPWPAPEDFDEYECVLVMTGATRATTAELEHHFRWCPGEVELAQVDAGTLTALLDGPGDGATEDRDGDVRTDESQDPAVIIARDVLRAQADALAAAPEDVRTAAWLASVRETAAAAVRELVAAGVLDGEDATAAFDTQAVDTDAETDVGAGIEALAAVLGGLLARLEPRAVRPSSASAATADADAAEGPARAADAVPGADPTGTPGTRGARPTSRVLKVDQAVVDRLLDLVGQLVVAKNALPFLAAAAEEQWNARGLARQIKDQYAVVDRISEELQAAVMDVRMLPMSVAFARFPRMVRDLSRTLGKQVELEQVGEETAADKDVIEMLGDPLVHLVRNSLDHGIETPEERLAAGKPAQARLTLRAAQEPDAVVVDIVDDGRGIDPVKIKQRAYERGLIDEERLATMSDEEAIDLIFVPGFSTAATVSDVSGRGVGMDAVRASVAAAGGTVRLTSTLGEGSTVRLRLPLSMAVSRVMIVSVDGQRFGVPVDVVVETVRVPRSRLARVEHQDVLVLRDTVVPLVDLAGTLRLREEAEPGEQVSILVTRPDGQDIGLVVDNFHEGVEVMLKPLEGILAGVRHFCGTALMGDGSVLLVLDVKEVLADAGEAVR